MVDLADLAQRAGLDHLGAAASEALALPWLPIWVTTFEVRGQLAQFAGFGNAVRQRLFAVDVLADLHERLAERGVPVVGRGDQHRVEAGRILEQLAIVVVRLGVLGRLAARIGRRLGPCRSAPDPDRRGPPSSRRRRAAPS